MTARLKRETGELIGEPPLKERRAICPKCGKNVRTYTEYHVEFLVDHREGMTWDWCKGGGMRVTEGEG